MRESITGQLRSNIREFWNERLMLRAELFLAISDSVYYRDHCRAKSTTGRRLHKYSVRDADKNRKQARAWIRGGTQDNTSSTHGFGYVWGMMQLMGHMDWELTKFIEMMERLWAAVDADHSVGKRIILIMKGIKSENSGRFVTIDRDAEFLEMLDGTDEPW